MGETWSLAVALDCERLDAAPLRVALARATEVEIGRGAERKVSREGARVRIDLADKPASSVHAHLQPSADGWLVADAASRNGTLRNGKRLGRERLADGDVIECGSTSCCCGGRRAA